MKVNITVNDELMKRIDDYAEQNYLTRSGLFTLSATQYLNGVQMMAAIQEISVCMRKIADTGHLDEETETRLSDLERFVKFITAK